MVKRRRYIPDLASDMAECDANYVRLSRLFPDMREQDSRHFAIEGVTDDGAEVRIDIRERCPFTTMLSVQVNNGDEHSWVRWPELEVRVYHDVASAEVISFQRKRHFRYRYELPNDQMYQPDEKSQINRFLGELLSFCLANGRAVESMQFDS